MRVVYLMDDEHLSHDAIKTKIPLAWDVLTFGECIDKEGRIFRGNYISDDLIRSLSELVDSDLTEKKYAEREIQKSIKNHVPVPGYDYNDVCAP